VGHVGRDMMYYGEWHAGEWRRIKDSVITALDTTHQRLAALSFAELTEARLDLAFDLLEHEIQHHGQLIRFIYANRLTFPRNWNERYTV
jgi:hypothetical protein